MDANNHVASSAYQQAMDHPSIGLLTQTFKFHTGLCECVEEDMSKLKLCVKDTQDRAVWRNGILGNCLPVTRAVVRKKRR